MARSNVDLANDDWQAVEISSEGYKVINNCPILFKRSADMLPLPVPTGGVSISALRPFVNCSDDEFILLQGWLVGALNPAGPYPILEVCGEQGAAKSSLCRMVRVLIDPNTADLETSPKTFDDVKLAAHSCHLLAYDNLSGLSPEMSDIFCGVSTGTNKRDRALYRIMTQSSTVLRSQWLGMELIRLR